MVAVVALDAEQMLAEDERRPGDEDDSGESEDSEDAVQDCASLLQEDPGQQGGKHRITEEQRSGWSIAERERGLMSGTPRPERD